MLRILVAVLLVAGTAGAINVTVVNTQVKLYAGMLSEGELHRFPGTDLTHGFWSCPLLGGYAGADLYLVVPNSAPEDVVVLWTVPDRTWVPHLATGNPLRASGYSVSSGFGIPGSCPVFMVEGRQLAEPVVYTVVGCDERFYDCPALPIPSVDAP